MILPKRQLFSIYSWSSLDVHRVNVGIAGNDAWSPRHTNRTSVVQFYIQQWPLNSLFRNTCTGTCIALGCQLNHPLALILWKTDWMNWRFCAHREMVHSMRFVNNLCSCLPCKQNMCTYLCSFFFMVKYGIKCSEMVFRVSWNEFDFWQADRGKIYVRKKIRTIEFSVVSGCSIDFVFDRYCCTIWGSFQCPFSLMAQKRSRLLLVSPSHCINTRSSHAVFQILLPSLLDKIFIWKNYFSVAHFSELQSTI